MANMRTLQTVAAACGLAALLGASLASSPALASPFHAKITAAQARAIALKRFPGKNTVPVRLEHEEGGWQYSVMVRSGKALREVMVDATNGKIATVESTSRAEEQREAKADAAKARTSTHKAHHAPKSRK